MAIWVFVKPYYGLHRDSLGELEKLLGNPSKISAYWTETIKIGLQRGPN